MIEAEAAGRGGLDSPDLGGQGEAGQARTSGYGTVLSTEEGEEEHLTQRG